MDTPSGRGDWEVDAAELAEARREAVGRRRWRRCAVGWRPPGGGRADRTRSRSPAYDRGFERRRRPAAQDLGCVGTVLVTPATSTPDAEAGGLPQRAVGVSIMEVAAGGAVGQRAWPLVAQDSLVGKRARQDAGRFGATTAVVSRQRSSDPPGRAIASVTGLGQVMPRRSASSRRMTGAARARRANHASVLSSAAGCRRPSGCSPETGEVKAMLAIWARMKSLCVFSQPCSSSGNARP